MLAVALALFAVACGNEAALSVQLRALPTETPLAGIETLEVTVFRNETIVQSSRVIWDGRAVDLEPVRRAEKLHIAILGLLADDTVQSQGEVDPQLPTAGGSCCVTDCFCLKQTFDDGNCTCGDAACRDSCVTAP
jgi:hypothetical protein